MAQADFSMALRLCEEAKLVLKREVKALRVENERLRQDREKAVNEGKPVLEDCLRMFEEENDLLRMAKDLKATADTNTSLRVAARGGLSMYGLQRFPVTLYKQQWIKLILNRSRIRRVHQEERRRTQVSLTSQLLRSSKW